jgi:hypothetical protein
VTPAAYARLARCLGELSAARARAARSRATREPPPDEALAALAAVAGDPALVETLHRHHLIALLSATLAAEEIGARLPPEALAALRVELPRARPRPEEDLRTIAEIRDAFGRAGIDWMLLKGLYFAERLYDGLDRRTQHDVDLAVRRRDARRAGRALRDLGYAERWRDLHSVNWERGGARIDLHSCFRSAPAYRLDEERIWADRARGIVAGVPFTTPSDEHTLLLLVLSLLQDVGLGAVKLKQILDAYLLAAQIDASFDWPGFFARREEEGTLPIAVNVLDLVMRVFDAAAALPRLAAALAPHARLVVAPERGRALALVGAARRAPESRAWFFAVYPGSIARYWLWLLPRKLPTYLRGRAPRRGPSSIVPRLATLRALLAARRAAGR